jgi:predicted regulator of Ras-like GTPase activity (Roadblock/LC7/MglB family)
MNLSRAERIQELLSDIRRIDPDIEGTAVATNEGLVIASSLNENLDEERLSAVCAAVNEAIRRTAEELDKGRPTEVFIHAPQGYIFIMRVGAASLLVAVTRRTANVGLILLDMRKIAREVTPILD